jgi:hypothetical protein
MTALLGDIVAVTWIATRAGMSEKQTNALQWKPLNGIIENVINRLGKIERWEREMGERERERERGERGEREGERERER